MLVQATFYADYLAAWARRAKAAGYFDDLFTDDIEINGTELERHTRDALEVWCGLPRCHATIEEVVRDRERREYEIEARAEFGA